MSKLLILIVLSAVSLQAHTAPVADLEVPLVRDLAVIGERIQATGEPCVLYVARRDCAFCRRLEKDVLLPMARGGELAEFCIVRLEWDDGQLPDFDGITRSASEIVSGYSVRVTPTLVFVGRRGRQVAEPLIGYQGVDLYWQMLRQRIARARQQMNSN